MTVTDSARVQRTVVPPPASADPVDTLTGSQWPSSLRTLVTPLIFIDGVRASLSEMHALRIDRIESIEVIKGEAAELYYADPRAAVGVISITMKPGGRAN